MTYLFLIFQIFVILGVTYIWNTYILVKLSQRLGKISTSTSHGIIPAFLLENEDSSFLKILKKIYWFIAICVCISLVLA